MEIDIKIDDVLAYAKTAFILDRKETIEAISKIRKLWGLDKDRVPYEDFNNWRNNLQDDFPLSPKAASILYEAKDNIGEDSTKAGDIAGLDRMDFEVEQLLLRLGIPISFHELMLKAIVCGEVRNENWERVKVGNKNSVDKRWIYDVSGVYFPLERFYNGDTKQDIKRDREWYWLKNKGETYIQISKKTPYRKSVEAEDFVDNIKHQVRRYKSFLKLGDI